jgi:hypothetical protein
MLRAGRLRGRLAGILSHLDSLPATQVGEAEMQGEGGEQVV